MYGKELRWGQKTRGTRGPFSMQRQASLLECLFALHAEARGDLASSILVPAWPGMEHPPAFCRSTTGASCHPPVLLEMSWTCPQCTAHCGAHRRTCTTWNCRTKRPNAVSAPRCRFLCWPLCLPSLLLGGWSSAGMCNFRSQTNHRSYAHVMSCYVCIDFASSHQLWLSRDQPHDDFSLRVRRCFSLKVVPAMKPGSAASKVE